MIAKMNYKKNKNVKRNNKIDDGLIKFKKALYKFIWI